MNNASCHSICDKRFVSFKVYISITGPPRTYKPLFSQHSLYNSAFKTTDPIKIFDGSNCAEIFREQKKIKETGPNKTIVSKFLTKTNN
jgi:hypothetical protein